MPVPRAPQAAWTQGDILSPGDPAEPMPAEAGGAGPAPAAGPGSGNGGSKGPLASAPPAQSRRYCRAPRAPAPWPGPGSLQSPRALGAPQSGQRSRPASSRPSPVGPVQQAPGVWLHQDGCAPAFRGDNTHPPSPAWTSPGGMHHRAGDKAWGGEATSKTVWEPLGVTVSRQGPPCSPAASPAWAPPWSSSQPGSLPTPSRPAHGSCRPAGNDTLTGEGHRPFALKTGRPGCPSGWVSGLTQVSRALSRARPQLQTLLLLEGRLQAMRAAMLAGPQHAGDTHPIL